MPLFFIIFGSLLSVCGGVTSATGFKDPFESLVVVLFGMVFVGMGLMLVELKKGRQ